MAAQYFLALDGIEVEPGQASQRFLVVLGELSLSDAAVGGADSCSCSATSTMAEQGDIFSRLQLQLRIILIEFQQAELDEMITRTGSPELMPGPVLPLARDPANRPILVHHGMLPRLLVLDAHAKPRSSFEGIPIARDILPQCFGGNVEDRHFHSARNIDADRIGNDATFCCEHTSDGQTVAHMSIGHQCRRHRLGNEARLLHLLVRSLINV